MGSEQPGRGEAGSILFTPWTTLADIALNLERGEKMGFPADGRWLVTLVLLYPGLAMTRMAELAGDILCERFEDPAPELSLVIPLHPELVLPWRFRPGRRGALLPPRRALLGRAHRRETGGRSGGSRGPRSSSARIRSTAAALVFYPPGSATRSRPPLALCQGPARGPPKAGAAPPQRPRACRGRAFVGSDRRRGTSGAPVWVRRSSERPTPEGSRAWPPRAGGRVAAPGVSARLSPPRTETTSRAMCAPRRPACAASRPRGQPGQRTGGEAVARPPSGRRDRPDRSARGRPPRPVRIV